MSTRQKILMYFVTLALAIVVSSFQVFAQDPIVQAALEKVGNEWRLDNPALLLLEKSSEITMSGQDSLKIQRLAGSGKARAYWEVGALQPNSSLGYIEFWLYDQFEPGEGAIDGLRLFCGTGIKDAGASIGIYPANFSAGEVPAEDPEGIGKYYVYDYMGTLQKVKIYAKRSKGWHKFGIEFLPNNTINFYLDDELQGSIKEMVPVFGAYGMGQFYIYSGYYPPESREGYSGKLVSTMFLDDIKVYKAKP